MRVLCRHGHFSFYPRDADDISRFSNYFSVTLKREEDYYTFERLFEAPHYSLLGKPYINLPAIETYEGSPWDVMRENGFVYHLGTGLIVPKASIVSIVEIPMVGHYFRAGGSLIQPGSRTLLGRQILSYSGEFIKEGLSLRISEFEYE